MASETVLVQIPLQALERAGVISLESQTATLVMAAVVVQGFRSFGTSFKFDLPLTGKRMNVRARFDIIHEEFEVTAGDIKPEVTHG